MRLRHPASTKYPLGDYISSLRARAERTTGFSWFMLQPRTTYTPRSGRHCGGTPTRSLAVPTCSAAGGNIERSDGIFCSQFVGDAIEQSGKIVSAHFRESPVSLYGKLSEFYQSQTERHHQRCVDGA